MSDTHPHFGADARIAEVLAADPDVVTRLAALHPLLQRLADEPARRTMGELATLADIAEIISIDIKDVLTVVNARRPDACVRAFRDVAPEARPPWMADFDAQRAAVVDVRPLIAAGHEPFAAIMGCVATMPAGGSLIIDAPFNPLPLRRILGNKGVMTYGERLGGDHWRIYGRREGEDTPTAIVPLPEVHGARLWRDADGAHIDVRALAAPAPLIAVLAFIDSGDHDGIVIMHHNREPVYLFPELSERRWSWREVPGESGERRWLLRRIGS